MIDGKVFIETVKKYFDFLHTEFRMSLIKEEVRGNVFYNIEYGDELKIISVSYENIEDFFQVIISKLQNGKIPNYDDLTNTIHLNTLNSAIYSKIDRNDALVNNEFFARFQPTNVIERKLLKSAKDLRLVFTHSNKLKLWQN